MSEEKTTTAETKEIAVSADALAKARRDAVTKPAEQISVGGTTLAELRRASDAQDEQARKERLDREEKARRDRATRGTHEELKVIVGDAGVHVVPDDAKEQADEGKKEGEKGNGEKKAQGGSNQPKSSTLPPPPNSPPESAT